MLIVVNSSDSSANVIEMPKTRINEHFHRPEPGLRSENPTTTAAANVMSAGIDIWNAAAEACPEDSAAKLW